MAEPDIDTLLLCLLGIDASGNHTQQQPPRFPALAALGLSRMR